MSFNVLTNLFSPLRHVHPMAAGRIAMFTGGGSQTQTVTQEMPEEMKPFFFGENGILTAAQNLYGQPLNLPDQQVAGLSAPQTTAADLAMSGVGAYLPQLQQGFNALNQGQGGITSAMGMVPGAVFGGQAGLTNAMGQIPGITSAANQGFNTAAQGFQNAGQLGTDLAQSGMQGMAAGVQTSADLGGRAYDTLTSLGGQSVGAGQQGAQNITSAAGASQGSTAAAQQGAQSAAQFGQNVATQGLAGLAGASSQFTPDQISAFMNPYETAAIDAAMGDIGRQGDIQAKGLRSKAVSAGAFGGSRGAIEERELGRNVMQQQANTAATMRAQGFQDAATRAQKAFEDAKARQLSQGTVTGQLGQMGSSAGIQGAQTSGSLGLQQGELGLKGATAATDATLAGLGQGLSAAQNAGQLGTTMGGQQISAGQGMGNLGLGVGQLGQTTAGGLADIASAQGSLGLQGTGMLGDLSQAYGNLGLQGANTLGNLGTSMGNLGATFGNMAQLGQGMGVQDINTLLGIGSMLQLQEQDILDTQYANQYADVMAPYQQLGYYSDIVQGVPTMPFGNQTTTSPGPSAASQIAGLGMGIGGLNQAGFFGQTP